MATYFTSDFSGFPTGWTKRWTTPVTTDWTVSGGELSAKPGSNVESMVTVDSITDDDDINQLLKVKTDTAATYCHVIAARGSGAVGSEQCYSITINQSGNLRIYKIISGTPTSLGSTTVTIAINTWYWIRFTVVTDGASSDLTATLWADGGSEGSPDASLTASNDASISGAGWAGPFVRAAALITWDQWSIGTNGDTAPSSAGATSLAMARSFPRAILNF